LSAVSSYHGRLHAGQTWAQRITAGAEVTLAPGFAVTPWFGLFAPAGTPPAIIAKVHAETVRALADPEVRAKFADRGFEIIGGTTEEFRALIAAEIPRIATLLQSRGLNPQ
jgi:tripartite-type tricarboxylate transporter receptor subunit TctC